MTSPPPLRYSSGMGDSRIKLLTPREREVLLLVAYDRGTDAIAFELKRSSHTVEAQIKSARAKLGGVTRYEAAAMLRAAEGHQPLVNQPSAMGRLGDVRPSGLRHDDAGRALAPAEAPEPRHEASPLISPPHVIGVLVKIVAIAALLALLAILTPLLIDSAARTFDQLFHR